MVRPQDLGTSPAKNRYTLSVPQEWFDNALSNQSLVIVDRQTNIIIGSSRYYETDIDRNETSISYTFLVKEYWRGTTNRLLTELMFRHAWEHFDTVWLHIAEDNIRSRTSAEKIGAQLDHIGEKYALPYCWYNLQKGVI